MSRSSSYSSPGSSLITTLKADNDRDDPFAFVPEDNDDDDFETTSRHRHRKKKDVQRRGAAASSSSSANSSSANSDDSNVNEEDSSTPASTVVSATKPSPCIMVNSLNIKQKALVSKTVKSLGGKILIHSDDVGSVTHFVVGTVDPQQQQPGGAYVALSRNHKQQSAMLMGKWQLSVQWVVDSVAAGEWLDEEKYEIVGDAKAKTLIPGGPKKARLFVHQIQTSSNNTNEQQDRGGSLFNGLTMYVGPKTKLSQKRNEYSYLLLLGEGRVVESLDGLSKLSTNSDTHGTNGNGDGENSEDGAKKRQQHVLICDRNGAPRAARDLIGTGHLTAVTEEWALDSISNFTLMDMSAYSIKPGRSRRRR